MRRAFIFLGTAIGAIALCMGAASAGVVTVTGGQKVKISGTINGVPIEQINNTSEVDGGTISLSDNSLAYCVDVTNPNMQVGFAFDQVPLGQLAGMGGLNSSNLQIIAAIATYEYPNTDPRFTLNGSTDRKGAGVQAAIWHYSNNFMIDASSTDAIVVANYNTVINRVNTNVYPSLNGGLNTSLQSPAATTGVTGDVIGPFVVHTGASSLDLTLAGGTRVDASGNPVAGTSVVDGEQIFVKSGTAGTATISVNGLIHVPTSVGYTGPPAGSNSGASADAVGAPKPQQPLAGIGSSSQPTSASATAEWQGRVIPTVPTSVAGERIQAPANIVQAPSSPGVSVEAAQVEAGSLPTTGNNGGLLWMGVALLLSGALVMALREVFRNSHA